MGAGTRIESNQGEKMYQLARAIRISDGQQASVRSEFDADSAGKIPREVLSTLYLGVNLGPEFDSRVNKLARDFGFTYSPDSERDNAVLMTNKHLNNGVIYEASLRHEGTGYEAHEVVFEGITTRDTSEA